MLTTTSRLCGAFRQYTRAARLTQVAEQQSNSTSCPPSRQPARPPAGQSIIMPGAPPPKNGGGGGLSLYADLLDPPTDTSASISRAPQVSQEALEAVKEQESSASKKPVDPALRFQPFQSIRRPQPKTQKPKASFPKAAAPAGGAAGAPAAGGNGSATAASAAPVPVKSTLADWAATEDDEWMYAGEKRPRNKKKRRKNDARAETNWDEIYDPSRPTNVEEYLRSDEHIQEVREWKALLYRHRRPAKRQSSWDSDEDEDRPMTSMSCHCPCFVPRKCGILILSALYRQVCSTAFLLLRATSSIASARSPGFGAGRQDRR